MFPHGKCDDDIPAYSCAKHKDAYARWLEQHPEYRETENSLRQRQHHVPVKKKEFVPIEVQKRSAEQKILGVVSGKITSRRRGKRRSYWTVARILSDLTPIVRREGCIDRSMLYRDYHSLHSAIAMPSSQLCVEVESLRTSTPSDRFGWVARRFGLEPFLVRTRVRPGEWQSGRPWNRTYRERWVYMKPRQKRTKRLRKGGLR